MRLLLHKGRHIVVSQLSDDTDSLDGQETIQVAWAALTDKVEGSKRRGKRPDYSKPVPVSELELLDHSSVSERVFELAQKGVPDSKGHLQLQKTEQTEQSSSED